MARIGLIDVDGHNFPNLALMKLAAYHRGLGDEVGMWDRMVQYAKPYDLVYKAKVFDESLTADEDYPILADEVIMGGTGYDLTSRLLEVVEHQYPDYGLYGEKRAIGFLTRGCPRGCGFCIVGEKEGLKSYQVAELSEFYRGQKEIVLLDPNLTASPDCKRLFKELAATERLVTFNQGIDIRCMDDEKVHLLNQIKTKVIHFAWDNYEFKTYDKLRALRPLFTQEKRSLAVYVLTNYNTTHEEDLERIYKLRELEYNPYVMRFDRSNAPEITNQLARWVNNKFVWWKCDNFAEYKSSGVDNPADEMQMEI